jgi:outer membrane usher protein
MTYGLYRDAARTRPWGDGSFGTSTVTSTGGGVNVVRTHTVYGRLPAQGVPPPGSYSDTVTVTITY